MFEKMTVEQYCEILASKAPAPGGGSALPLVGAEACALVEMSVNVTLQKLSENDEQYDYLMRELSSCKRARIRLYAQSNEDAAAYQRIVDARKLPKTTDAEIQARTNALQKEFHRASLVPMDVMNLCLDVMKRASARVLPNLSKYIVSDCEIGISLLRTVIEFSVKNVYANTCFIHDEALKRSLERQAEEIPAAANV